MNERTRNLAIAVLSGLAGRGVALLSPLIVMGPMLNHLGTVLFGIWLTAVSLAALANFLDFGIGNAALTRLSEAFGRNELSAVRALLGQAYALLAGLSGGFILLTLAATLVFVNVVPETPEIGEQAAVVALVLCTLFLTFSTGLLVRLLQARQSYLHAQLVQVVGPLSALCASLSGIALGLSPVMVLVLYTVAAPLTQALWSVVFFAVTPALRPVFVGINRVSMRSLTSLGGAYFIVSILTALGMNMDNVIIAARAGAAAVTDFGVPARLGSLLMLIVFTLFMPLWSLFGEALGRGDRRWLVRATFGMSAAGSLGVFIVGLGLVVFADPIIQLWMGRGFPAQQSILMGLVAAATLIAATSPFNMVLNAAGMARQQILPWAFFVATSGAAKLLLVTPQTTWWVPWITALGYAVCVTPRVVQLAVGRLREMPSQSLAAAGASSGTALGSGLSE